jgi:hypothetical protein
MYAVPISSDARQTIHVRFTGKCMLYAIHKNTTILIEGEITHIVYMVSCLQTNTKLKAADKSEK